MFIGQAQRRFPAEGGTLVNHTRRHTASPNSRTVQHFWLRIGIVRIINRIHATCHIWAIWSLTTVHKVQTHMALATDIPHVNTCANAISCKQNDTYRPVSGRCFINRIYRDSLRPPVALLSASAEFICVKNSS